MKLAGMGHPIYQAWYDSQIARARGLAFSNGGSIRLGSAQPKIKLEPAGN